MPQPKAKYYIDHECDIKIYRSIRYSHYLSKINNMKYNTRNISDDVGIIQLIYRSAPVNG